MIQNSSQFKKFEVCKPNICLGTAQFGMNYGVKRKGQIANNEIKEILNFAFDQKINYLDTAQSTEALKIILVSLT